jgi:SRSO17 transposase
MLARAFEAGVAARWFTGDCVYGRDPGLRAFLEEHRCAYVLAVDWDQRLLWEQGAIRAQTLADRLPAHAWQTLSCGAGAKGEREYAWACLSLDPPAQAGFCYWLLVRQSLADPSDRAYYLVFAPQATSLTRMLQVAGTRWCIEMGFESAKGQVGLDEYEVRSFHGWYRHMTLSLWAHALLCVLRQQTQESLPKGGSVFPRKYPGPFQTFLHARGLCCR